MKNLLLLLCILNFTWNYSQIRNEHQRLIDSINQKKWDSVSVDLQNLDSLEVTDIILKKYKDSIIIDKKLLMSQQDIPITPFAMLNTSEPKRWFVFGQNSLVFNQSSFSNWYSGGNDNIGVIAKVNYNFNYKNGKHFLENNAQLGYGFVSSTGQATRKTEDYINLSSNYGYELAHNYYLSSGFQFLSQIGAGYNYSTTPDPTFEDRVSRFMAPAYLNLGVGLSYNPKENFQVIFRPINGKFTFVLDPKLQTKGRFGMEKDGQSMRTELGAMINTTYRFSIIKDITLLNQLNLFVNYLSHTERVDIAYNAVLNMKFNRFITTIVSLDLVYDHDQIEGLQTKQTLGVGLIYNFGFKLEKEKTKNTIKPFL